MIELYPGAIISLTGSANIMCISFLEYISVCLCFRLFVNFECLIGVIVCLVCLFVFLRGFNKN